MTEPTCRRCHAPAQVVHADEGSPDRYYCLRHFLRLHDVSPGSSTRLLARAERSRRVSDNFVKVQCYSRTALAPAFLDNVAAPLWVVRDIMQRGLIELFVKVGDLGGKPPEDVHLRIVRGDIMHGAEPEAIAVTADVFIPAENLPDEYGATS